MWIYVQRTGTLYAPDGSDAGTCYSGHGKGLNNPDYQTKVGVGPLPTGAYIIGPPHKPVDHLGPYALLLVPAKTTNMHGRSGFFMHGDNSAMNHTASDGCIIANHSIRVQVEDSSDADLIVVAEESDVQVMRLAVPRQGPRPVSARTT